MYFELKNIGAIKDAKIELGKFTLISGKNNTGKTYVNYSLYGFLNYLREKPFSQLFTNSHAQFQKSGMIDLKEAENDLNPVLTLLTKNYVSTLKDVFSANAEEFAESEFHLGSEKLLIDYTNSFELSTMQYDVIKEENSNILEINLHSNVKSSRLINLIIDEILFKFFLTPYFPCPFILSAERTGIQLFQKELDRTRSNFVTSALKENSNLALLEEKLDRFALPIEKNLDFTRDTDVIKSDSFLKQEQPELLSYIEDMLGIEYEIRDGRKVVIDKTTDKTLPHYMSSTSVRALFDLHIWLKHKAQKGDILFIDEPELNLHPENQIKMARLLVRLINSGIRVFITTHSDYIIKELNNLLMLARDFPDKNVLIKELGYTSSELLHEEDLRAYIAHTDGSVAQVEIDEYGMIQTGFDDAIVQINETSDKIAEAIHNQ
jgi:predicted ATPase